MSHPSLSMPLESSLLSAVQKRFKALAVLDPTLVWRKRHGSSMGVTGDADLYGVWRGVHFEIELKRPGENPTILQNFRLNQWQKAGCQTFVVHSLEELAAALQKICPSDSTL